MSNNSLRKSSTANGQIVVDCDSGCIGVVYGSDIWSVFPSVPSGWTTATTSNGSTFVKATGTGGALGRKLIAYVTSVHYASNTGSSDVINNVNCSDGHVRLYEGDTSSATRASYGYLAYRPL